jgi:hypothetical protein
MHASQEQQHGDSGFDRAADVSSVDRRRPTSHLSLQQCREHALSSLELALDGQQREGRTSGFLTRVHLRHALHDLCVSAYRSGLHAEQVIVMVKEIWEALAGTTHLASPHRQRDMLSEVVTFCIHDFYANEDAAGGMTLQHVRAD